MKVEIEHKHREIIEQSKQGSQIAMYQLYQQYAKAMFNISVRMMNNREEAEDLLQDAFTDAFRKLDSFRYESTFGAWIKQIVINKCINELKRRKIDMMLSEEVEAYDRIDEGRFDDSEIKYEVKKVKLALRALPDGYRVIFSLYALEGYDHKEIAAIMEVSESTSKSQYLRAKNRIKEIINRQDNER